MKHPSKKEIKEQVERLKNQSSGSANSVPTSVGKIADKKTSQRIRKQGV